MTLDQNTLESIAEVLCDTEGAHHLQGWQLPSFFRQAGWSQVPEYDNSPRKLWTFQRLLEHQSDTEAIWQVVRRLTDPRTYQQDPSRASRVAERLNLFLVLEGWKVIYESNQPKIVEISPAMPSPASKAPTILKADLSKIVQDQAMATLLRSRLDEVTTCRDYGAHLAAIILLGSILEGILLEFAQQHIEQACRSPSAPKDRSTQKVRRLKDWKLSDLIEVAKSCKWIQHDVQKFTHTLREYRNFVHPRQQLEESFSPGLGTVTVCWDVVVAALNDLADFATEGT